MSGSAGELDVHGFGHVTTGHDQRRAAALTLAEIALRRTNNPARALADVLDALGLRRRP